jgi:peptidoglycan/xylan/chitin deacetylase (PgdA/CDA1 family)
MFPIRIPILMYHRVGDTEVDRRYTVKPKDFRRQMRYLRDHDYRVVKLETLLSLLDGEENVSGKVTAITFDDGFQDTFDQACPILKEFDLPATFFVISSLMGDSNRWMQRAGYPAAQLIDWKQARQLTADGFSIGSHTATHPILPEIDAASVASEIRDSKRCIEDQLSIAIRFFAYPYGRFDQRERDLVEACGYQAACSTRAGFNTRDVDRFALRRLDIYGTDQIATFGGNLVFGENQMNLSRVARYYVRRGIARFTPR